MSRPDSSTALAAIVVKNGVALGGLPTHERNPALAIAARCLAGDATPP